MFGLHDYLLECSDFDWPALLADWGFLLPAGYKVWLANRFGDPIVEFSDGSIHYLEIGALGLRRIADDREAFLQGLKAENNARDWFMIPLVDACVRAGMTLAPKRCYHFAIPPFLGGLYELGNIKTIGIAEYYGFMASIHQQTRDLPDGAQVRLVVTD